jgi:hypothetical protein
MKIVVIGGTGLGHLGSIKEFGVSRPGLEPGTL